MRRRYEVWFLRLGLADGSGAWWFRYLLLNLGRAGCPGNPAGLPVQIWATWFPRGGPPKSFIQGYGSEGLRLSDRGASPFLFAVGNNRIDDSSCDGSIEKDGHKIEWQLHYQSRFRVTLSDKGWIGFSRSPHSDAVFSGQIAFDGQVFSGDPLGFGVQGHNSGYRHRNQWTWTHAYFGDARGASTFEALVYEMPLGLRFRKAVLWHREQALVLRKFRESLRDPVELRWEFECGDGSGNELAVQVDGRGISLHRLPYLKTNCSGSFEVSNNSLARAQLRLRMGDSEQELVTAGGAVLEMAG